MPHGETAGAAIGQGNRKRNDEFSPAVRIGSILAGQLHDLFEPVAGTE